MSFYVAYPKDSHLRECLNALKVLADDTQRTEAHITVRGSYKKRLQENFIEKYLKIISGEELSISILD